MVLFPWKCDEQHDFDRFAFHSLSAILLPFVLVSVERATGHVNVSCSEPGAALRLLAHHLSRCRHPLHTSLEPSRLLADLLEHIPSAQDCSAHPQQHAL